MSNVTVVQSRWATLHHDVPRCELVLPMHTVTSSCIVRHGTAKLNWAEQLGSLCATRNAAGVRMR